MCEIQRDTKKNQPRQFSQREKHNNNLISKYYLLERGNIQTGEHRISIYVVLDVFVIRLTVSTRIKKIYTDRTSITGH